VSEATANDRTGRSEFAPEGPAPVAPSPSARKGAPDADIESVLAKLDSFWESEPSGFPSWAAQELTFGQLRLLFLLHARGPVAIGGIADWLHVGLPTASGVADRLERHGLAERRHRQDDRRIVECVLTEAGQRLLDDIVGMRSEATRRVLRVLSPEELAQLDHLLQVVIDRTTPPDPESTSAPPSPLARRQPATSSTVAEETP
jgi:DNA-binding MarR family transcriptional regulator